MQDARTSPRRLPRSCNSAGGPRYTVSGAPSLLMRVALLCILAAAPVFAEGVTIVLEFDGPKSDQSIAEMKREFAGIMKETALRFEFQSRTEASQTTTSDSVVLVKFKGKCRFEPVPYLSDERGPLAFTLS